MNRIVKRDPVMTGVLGGEFMVPEKEEPLIWHIHEELSFKTMLLATGPIHHVVKKQLNLM